MEVTQVCSSYSCSGKTKVGFHLGLMTKMIKPRDKQGQKLLKKFLMSKLFYRKLLNRKLRIISLCIKLIG